MLSQESIEKDKDLTYLSFSGIYGKKDAVRIHSGYS